MAGAMTGADGEPRTRTRNARGPRRVSIVSNTALIALKVVAGLITGSVAIITEAMHSAIDLLASFIAYFSVRQAEEPADEEHRYGHEKFENVAAAAEGVLILVGSRRDRLRGDPQPDPRAGAPDARHRHRRRRRSPPP